MMITRYYAITFDEPNEGWLCADNVAIALHMCCTNTRFEVKEIIPFDIKPKDEVANDGQEVSDRRV